MIYPKDILYEDNHIIVVNKRCGDLVQPDRETEEALENDIKAMIKVRDHKPGDVFLGVVHRIDRPVSGAVVFAKTSKALTRLNEMIRSGEIHKTYWAIVEARPAQEEGSLTHYIVRDGRTNRSRAYDKPKADGKKAMLNYRVLGCSTRYTLVEVELLTGRHHQIRAQLSKIGCIKAGRFGKFLACPGYPECKNTKPITQDTGVTCPKCGSRLLKKKSKSGYYYYGCERNPECDFMTWDSPTKKVCPDCGGVIYRHYTKEDKRYLCHKPGCGWNEPIATRGKKAAAEGEEPKKTTRGRKKTVDTAETTQVKKTTRGRKKAETAAEEPKKTTQKASTAKKTAKKSDETPKKTTRKKKTEAAE